MATSNTHQDAKTDADTSTDSISLGLYFDLRNPRGWRVDPSRTYGFALEMCEEAERLGAHSVWFTEHHKFDDDYLASPLTFASAVAARTKRIRIGTAVVIAPLHHPAEIAEQSAVVDLVSEGRLELGIGAGYRLPEYQLYGQSIERRYAATDGMARELRQLWGVGGVTPQPVQRRLPLWLGYQGPQGARRAGLLGEGLLTANGESWNAYATGLRDGGFSAAQAAMSGGIQGWVSEDPERDWPLVSKHLAYQLDSYRSAMVEGTGNPAPAPIDLERLRAGDVEGPLNQFFYDTPDRMADRIRAYVGSAPVETVFLWASIGGMPEQVVADNVETLCSRLAPLLSGSPGGSSRHHVLSATSGQPLVKDVT